MCIRDRFYILHRSTFVKCSKLRRPRLQSYAHFSIFFLNHLTIHAWAVRSQRTWWVYAEMFTQFGWLRPGMLMLMLISDLVTGQGSTKCNGWLWYLYKIYIIYNIYKRSRDLNNQYCSGIVSISRLGVAEQYGAGGEGEDAGLATLQPLRPLLLSLIHIWRCRRRG